MLGGRTTYEMMEGQWPTVVPGEAEASPQLRIQRGHILEIRPTAFAAHHHNSV